MSVSIVQQRGYIKMTRKQAKQEINNLHFPEVTEGDKVTYEGHEFTYTNGEWV